MTVNTVDQPSQKKTPANGSLFEATPQRIGLWGWLGLYFTGALLFFLLLIHVWLVHYSSTEPISFQRTVSALGSPFVRMIELGLLLFGFTHGLTGLRRILLDLEIFGKRRGKYLSWGIFLIGGLLVNWGLILFYSFPQ